MHGVKAAARIGEGHQDWGPGHAAPGLRFRGMGTYRRRVGESKPVRMVRAAGATVLVAVAAVVLTSCSAFGGAPGAGAASSSGPVLDPSIPSASPTETVASDTPAPVVSATAVSTSAPTASAAPRTAVVPAITTPDATAKVGPLDVAAIVTGVVESGGSCIVTLTSGSTTRTGTSHGVAAGSYTGCPAVTFTDVTAGTWQIRVRYDSSKAAGSSAVRTVLVG